MSATGPTTPGDGSAFSQESRCAECGRRATRRSALGMPGCDTCYPHWPKRPDAERGGESGEDRSAGRWCGVCSQYGSHHTDKHAEFRPAPLAEPDAPAPALPVGGDADEDLAFAIRRANNSCDTKADFLASDWLAARDAAIAREAAERALVEAADEVHREARWQTEQKQRSTLPEHAWHRYAAERLSLVERILRDRAASLGDGSGT